MSARLIVQLIIFAAAMVIIFMYIQPKFLVIQALQAEQEQYDLVIERATQFNALLNTLLNKTNSLSQSDLQRLERYLPQTTDTTAVAKNLEAVAWKSGLRPTSIVIQAEATENDEVRRVQAVDFEDTDTLAQQMTEELTTQMYDVSLIGTYANFKNFLIAIEANSYPIRVQALSVTPEDAGETEAAVDQYSFTMTVQTFSLASQ